MRGLPCPRCVRVCSSVRSTSASKLGPQGVIGDQAVFHVKRSERFCKACLLLTQQALKQNRAGIADGPETAGDALTPFLISESCVRSGTKHEVISKAFCPGRW